MPARTSHPSTAMITFGLQGKFNEADKLHLRAIGIQEMFFGPEHPSLAEFLGGRARVLHLQVTHVRFRGSVYVHAGTHRVAQDNAFLDHAHAVW